MPAQIERAGADLVKDVPALSLGMRKIGSCRFQRQRWSQLFPHPSEPHLDAVAHRLYAARRLVDVPGEAAADDLPQTVRKVLYVQLPLGRPSIEQAAQSLGLHVRTLQRQLSADGVAFSELVNEVRRDLVLRYLAQPGQSLTRVAELVGYGQISSFTRWFISQFQDTPSGWRGRMLEGGRSPSGRT